MVLLVLVVVCWVWKVMCVGWFRWWIGICGCCWKLSLSNLVRFCCGVCLMIFRVIFVFRVVVIGMILKICWWFV